ncbi:MAG: hypothetical protein HQK53_00610 [Oligoflexia bacterium]|nr:hypothetical protein [Oligoflexia bacterium]
MKKNLLSPFMAFMAAFLLLFSLNLFAAAAPTTGAADIEIEQAYSEWLQFQQNATIAVAQKIRQDGIQERIVETKLKTLHCLGEKFDERIDGYITM